MSHVVKLPRPGEIFGPDYRVDCELESDGLTAVFGATAQATGGRYALRCFLSRDAADWAAATEHFLQRARRAELFQDRRIVEVYAVQQDLGTFFSVAEWLEGLTLERYIEQHGPIPVGYALQLLAPCVQALAAAHRAGIVHGDLRPSNIFLCSATRTEAGLSRVQNFGYGMLSARSESSKQQAERWGEPRCTVPEDPHDEQSWVRADIHAFGSMLQRVIAGPLSNDTRGAGTAAIAQRAQHIPSAVAEIIARAIAVQPAERYASFDQMAEDLAKHMRARSTGSALRRTALQATIREMPAVTSAMIDCAPTPAAMTAPGVLYRNRPSPNSIVARNQGAEQHVDAIMQSGRSMSVIVNATALLPPHVERVGDDVRAYTWVKPASEIAAIDWLWIDPEPSNAGSNRSGFSLLPRWVGHVGICVALLVSIAVGIELVAQTRSKHAKPSTSLSHREPGLSLQPGPGMPIAIPSIAAESPVSAAVPNVAAQKPTTESVKPRPAQDPPPRTSPTASPAAPSRDGTKRASPARPTVTPNPAPVPNSRTRGVDVEVRGQSTELDAMHLL